VVRAIRARRAEAAPLRLPFGKLKVFPNARQEIITPQDLQRVFGLPASQLPAAIDLLKHCIVLQPLLADETEVYRLGGWVEKLLDPRIGLSVGYEIACDLARRVLDNVSSSNRSMRLARVRQVSFTGELLQMERTAVIDAIDVEVVVAARPELRVGLEVRDLVRSLLRTGDRNVRLTVILERMVG
jgi:hypothetical protein